MTRTKMKNIKLKKPKLYLNFLLFHATIMYYGIVKILDLQ